MAFLPAGAEATRAQREATAFSGQQTLPAVIVYERPGGLRTEDADRVSDDLGPRIWWPSRLSPRA